MKLKLATMALKERYVVLVLAQLLTETKISIPLKYEQLQTLAHKNWAIKTLLVKTFVEKYVSANTGGKSLGFKKWAVKINKIKL